MIVKPQYIPLRLLAVEALLNHLPPDTFGRAAIEDELARRQTGWRGEQELSFQLAGFRDTSTRILYDLHLSVRQETCQMDGVLLTQGFASIIEAKNYSGTLHFLPDGQMIRSIGNRNEGFPNPVLQVQRHSRMLKNWMAAGQYPTLAINPQVAIANPATMIENPANLRSVRDYVTHAEQIPSRINQFIKKHPENLSPQLLSQIEQQLLKANSEPSLDVLSGFKIRAEDLQHGIRCNHCHRYSMQRAYGTWKCSYCGGTSRTAHEQMILDYFLLLGPTMTNRQCREFLNVEDRKLVRNLLLKMNISPVGSGQGRGLYYERPSQKFYHEFYLKNKMRN